MHTITSEPVASTGAAIVPFPIPEDDIIPLITGVSLADADAKVIARRLHRCKWKARARFFNNIIRDSIINATILAEHAPTTDAGADFLTWGMIEMMRRIGETLDLWGVAEPVDVDSAALFHLSLNPKHLRAARDWNGRQPGKPSAWQFFDDAIGQRHPTLFTFFRMVALTHSCAAIVWKVGAKECPIANWPAPVGAA